MLNCVIFNNSVVITSPKKRDRKIVVKKSCIVLIITASFGLLANLCGDNCHLIVFTVVGRFFSLRSIFSFF